MILWLFAAISFGFIHDILSLLYVNVPPNSLVSINEAILESGNSTKCEHENQVTSSTWED